MPLITENFFIDNPNLNEIIILTPPHFNSFNIYFSSIFHHIAFADGNPFCIDMSHNFSFGHLYTHQIIDQNIEKFLKGQYRGL
jgi:hypothetical protein